MFSLFLLILLLLLRLKSSFDEAIQAINDVNTYKVNALPLMKETIDMFSDMADDGKKVVDKIENKNLIE